MDNKRYVTIKDIAAELGLSTSTVSRALTGGGEIRETTRQKVQEAAMRLGYHPNLLARNLSSHRSGIIGIIVPEFETGFFPRIILGIQDELHRSGYRVLITQSGESAEKERDNLELLLGNMVDGIIASVTKEGGNEELFQTVIKRGIPVVFFNRVYNLPRASKVMLDDRLLAREATAHLLAQGCRRIMHFTGPLNMQVAQNRLAGYRDAIVEFGASVEEGLVVESGINYEDGYEATRKVLSDMSPLPDAIFCFNDNLAIGAMKALKEAGKRIPKEIAVVGFSETDMSTVVEPPLTTVAQPRYRMGVEAAKIMIEQIQTQGRSLPTNLTLDAELHVRASSNKGGNVLGVHDR